MKQITFYLDFASPYAYLAFEQLPLALMGLSYRVIYQPMLLGAVLKHHGQLAPADVPAKRAWTYRQVHWLAQQNGVDLQLPAQHPFKPLGLLRLALACSATGQPNRYVCETLFRNVWQGGADAADAQRLQAVTAQLAPLRDPDSDVIKDELRAQTATAIARGVFGAPTFEVDDKLFWGLDALPMLQAYLAGDARLEELWTAALPR